MPRASLLPRSFLLRCWQERSNDNSGVVEPLLWRFSLREVIETPQEHSFNSPDQLLDFLLARLREDTLGE